MPADAREADGLYLPIVRACAVRHLFALSTLREMACSDGQEQKPNNNYNQNAYRLRHTRHTSASLSGLCHRAGLPANTQAICSRFVKSNLNWLPSNSRLFKGEL